MSLSGNGMTYVESIASCTNTCLNTTLMGAATIGPIHAGEIHDCVVQIIIDKGSDIKEFPGIKCMYKKHSTYELIM